MDSFTYTCNPSRVIFGTGTIDKLSSEITRLGLTTILILCTPQQKTEAENVQQLIAHNVTAIFSKATMHTPIEVTQEACELAVKLRADGIVSIGGGSTIGLGKAIGMRSSLPHICIPTTYAGSEMTPILGETVNGLKTTKRDSKILPTTVIYDVQLTMTLPKSLSATSGINAIAHAVEALYAPDTNPIVRLLAKEGITAMSQALRIIVRDGTNQQARVKALYGAWLCGICLGSTTMSLHHKLCHTLGGSFNLPHAETHTILLPHSVGYNSKATPSAMRDLVDALGGTNDDATEELNILLDDIGVERALSVYGFKETDIDQAVSLAMQQQYANPRPIERKSLHSTLYRAWKGQPAVVADL